MNKPVCWILTGPTASGKTALSIRLAEEHQGEIICMDSMQLYRGMDIGTAKPTRSERDEVKHHMLDVAEPTEAFSVAKYQEMAQDCVRDILLRGKQPIFVGGTGLYLRALRHPMAMGEVGADETIRRELETLAEEDGGREKLHRMLEEADSDTAARLHLNDVRRVVRALEVYRLTGKPFSMQPQLTQKAPFDYRVVSLTMDRQQLYDRIDRRVDVMLEEGLIDEVRRLQASGVPAHAQAMKALGYKEVIAYLQGEWSVEKMVYELKKGTRHYAKRQLTWMRREEDVCWVDALSPDVYEKIEHWFTRGEAQ